MPVALKRFSDSLMGVFSGIGVLLVVGIIGCHNTHLTPKVITVDNKQTAFVCSGSIQVSGSERGAYEVSFTDKDGSHDWRGLNRVEIDDMPAELERTVCHTQNSNSNESMTPRELPPEYIESLRKRNACEQRLHDKKISEVDGMTVGEACKQNPDRHP
jgi:hypothetical protein